MPFAKLFYLPKHGQVLAKLDKDEESSPELRWYVEPEGFGVCSLALGFHDTDDGWQKAEKAFADADEVTATKAAETILLALA
ncbi:MAG: hypothetical protein ACRCV9_03035 [Burkholderiaceae bacterium]